MQEIIHAFQLPDAASRFQAKKLPSDRQLLLIQVLFHVME